MDPQTEIYIEIQQGATWERVRSLIHNAPPECYLNINLIRNLWNEKNDRAQIMVPVCGSEVTVIDTANAPSSHKVVQGLASVLADNYRAQETPSSHPKPASTPRGKP